MSLQLIWAGRCSHRLGRRTILSFRYLELEVYQRSLAVHPHSGRWFPFLREDGNREGFQSSLCAAEVTIHREKENAPVAWQKKESENIPEVNHTKCGI